MSYETFHIGVDEFGEEFEIRCRVSESVDASTEAAPNDDKRWFTRDYHELWAMEHGKLFCPRSGAIITLRSLGWAKSALP